MIQDLKIGGINIDISTFSKASQTREVKLNVNGITIQIYSTIIAYLRLQLVEIPQKFGNQLLDKLGYLQACMCQEISYTNWIKKCYE